MYYETIEQNDIEKYLRIEDAKTVFKHNNSKQKQNIKNLTDKEIRNDVQNILALYKNVVVTRPRNLSIDKSIGDIEKRRVKELQTI